MGHDNFSPLISEIESERRDLANLVEEMEKLKNGLDEEPSRIELRAAGSILHDYYTGLEKIFRLIAVEVGGNLPSGEEWHKRLLDRMAVEIEGVRPPVIDSSLKERLGEYLRFRHLFRHIYGFELNWKRCEPLIRELPEIATELSDDLDEFQNFLRKISDT